jgi:methylated-DNA-[protein]-cysteine S-methyltransferase
MNNNPIWITDLQQTPLGALWLGVTKLGLALISFTDNQLDFESELTRRGYQPILKDPSITQAWHDQIQEYLQGKRRQFDLPIDWRAMTPFQQQALLATFEIPYGETRSYGQIAAQIGKPHAARAIGRAQATNPLPLVIPCHRVIGSDGKLHGYGGRGGLHTKAWLLALESDH